MQTTASPRLDFKKYSTWIAEGRSFNEVRTDMAALGFTDAEISRLIRTIDNDIQAQLLRKERNRQALALISMGAVLFLMGAGVTLYSFFSEQSSYVLWYGAILTGLVLCFSGIAKRE